MRGLNWLLGGILAGVLGAAVWVAIEYTTQREFAWMAWPVGLLVGWGVHKSAATDARGGTLRGALAALLALAAVLGAGWSKAEIMTKKAAGAATSAVTLKIIETEADGQKKAVETVETDAAPLDFGAPDTGLLHGTLESKPRSAFEDMDMLWLCLAALTAYVVGKGTGASAVGNKESASTEPSSDESHTEESATEAPADNAGDAGEGA